MKQPKEFTTEEVGMFLVAIGLGDKVPAFQENAVDGSMLVILSADDMKELGLSGLQGKKIKSQLQFFEESGGSQEDSDRMVALETENKMLKDEIARLTKPAAAPAPAPAPVKAPAPAPPQHHHDVARGAAGGAAKGAVKGAVVGGKKIFMVLLFS